MIWEFEVSLECMESLSERGRGEWKNINHTRKEAFAAKQAYRQEYVNSLHPGAQTSVFPSRGLFPQLPKGHALLSTFKTPEKKLVLGRCLFSLVVGKGPAHTSPSIPLLEERQHSGAGPRSQGLMKVTDKGQ